MKTPCDSPFIVLLLAVRGQNVQEEGLKHEGEEVIRAQRVSPVPRLHRTVSHRFLPKLRRQLVSNTLSLFSMFGFSLLATLV